MRSSPVTRLSRQRWRCRRVVSHRHPARRACKNLEMIAASSREGGGAWHRLLMNRRPHSTRALLTLLAVSSSLVSTGCIVTTSEHERLQRQVVELEKKVTARDEALEASLAKAQEQSEQLDRVLRSRAANLGATVDNMELDVAELRGQTEDARNDIAALSSSTSELREELDQRVADLEQRLNRATQIPEGKTALRREADRLLANNDNRQARMFYRTYLSRYPGDTREPVIRFHIGLTLYNEREFRSALSEFYWIVQKASGDAVIYDALYYSGLAFAKLGQCDKSSAYFKALSDEEKAPSKYRSAAANQLEIFAKDDGTICTDRMADGARTGAGTETGGQTSGQTGEGTSDGATGDKAVDPDGASATPPSGS